MIGINKESHLSPIKLGDSWTFKIGKGGYPKIKKCWRKKGIKEYVIVFNIKLSSYATIIFFSYVLCK